MRVLKDERARFLVVGAFNTLFGYGTFTLLYVLFGAHVHYLVLATAAHFIAVSVAFTLYRKYVFPVSGRVWPAFLRYNVTVLGNLGLGLVLMALFVRWAGFNPIVAQGITIVVVTVSNYFLHKFFTFRRAEPPFTGV